MLYCYHLSFFITF
jgi:hypothetical protein